MIWRGQRRMVGAMETIARLNVPRRVIGLAVCVEHARWRCSGQGDIYTGITGKSAEIMGFLYLLAQLRIANDSGLQ